MLGAATALRVGRLGFSAGLIFLSALACQYATYYYGLYRFPRLSCDDP
jgi:hypothetical protein